MGVNLGFNLGCDGPTIRGRGPEGGRCRAEAGGRDVGALIRTPPLRGGVFLSGKKPFQERKKLRALKKTETDSEKKKAGFEKITKKNAIFDEK